MGKIRLSMKGGNKLLLKGCLTPQRQAVGIEIMNDEGRSVTRLALSLNQFTEFLVSNSETDCTIEHAFDREGNLCKDVVTEPNLVADRASDQLKRTKKELREKLEDLKKDLYEMVHGNLNKTKAKQLLSDLGTFQSWWESNIDFQVQEALSEIDQVTSEARTQLVSSVSAMIGNADESVVRSLVCDTSPDLVPKLALPAPVEPALDPLHKKKERTAKPLYEMDCGELADAISNRLRHIEVSPTNTETKDGKILFGAGAHETRDGVKVTYISYQGQSKLSRNEAAEYLRFLRNNGAAEFKTHYQYFREIEELAKQNAGNFGAHPSKEDK